MDPFSNALNIASVAVNTCLVAYKLCQVWKDAPKEIYELKDELMRSEEFFQGVKHNALEQIQETHHGPAKASNKGLLELLGKGEIVLVEIRNVLNNLLDASNDCTAVIISRKLKARWLKHRIHTRRMQKCLKEIMIKICAVLISENISISTQLHSSLHQMESNIKSEITAQISTTQYHASSAVTEASLRIAADMSRRFEGTLAAIDSRIDRRLQQQSTQMKLFIDDNPRRTSTTELERLNDQIHKQSQQIESIHTLLTGLQSSLITDQGSLIHTNDTTSNAVTTYMLGTTNSIYKLSPFPSCDKPCLCACHAARGHTMWSTEALQPLLGSLSISYYGPTRRQGRGECTIPKCRNSQNRGNRRLRVDYRLPLWLLGLALTVFVSTGPPSPELLMRVVRRVPRNSRGITRSIFYLAMRNDVEGLKSALANRSASIYDEFADDGTTALRQAWVAVHSKAAAKVLIQAGADLFQGPTPSTTPMAAFLKSLHIDASCIDDIASILPISLDTVLDEWGYTDLHKIILGILPLDLPTVLRYSRSLVSEVNKATITGITPLHLAAMRNNVPALHALLMSGADQSLQSGEGLTTFYYACLGHSLEAARLLLDHGASIYASVEEMTPLHYVSFSAHDDGPQLTDLLMDRGVDVNAQNESGSSPLAAAVMNDHVKLAEHFLNRGADINARDKGGDPALFEAVVNGSHRSARMLLARGADYRTVDFCGLGILHLLADSADEEMLDIFIDASMSGLDATLSDTGGLTAMEALEKRSPPVSARYRNKFLGLLKSTGSPDPYPRESLSEEDFFSDSSEEDYFDATEIHDSERLHVQVENEVIQAGCVDEGHIDDEMLQVDDNKFRHNEDNYKFDSKTWKRIRQLP